MLSNVITLDLVETRNAADYAPVYVLPSMKMKSCRYSIGIGRYNVAM